MLKDFCCCCDWNEHYYWEFYILLGLLRKSHQGLSHPPRTIITSKNNKCMFKINTNTQDPRIWSRMGRNIHQKLMDFFFKKWQLLKSFRTRANSGNRFTYYNSLYCSSMWYIPKKMPKWLYPCSLILDYLGYCVQWAYSQESNVWIRLHPFCSEILVLGLWTGKHMYVQFWGPLSDLKFHSTVC